jgi:outer membrane protein insertion porin family
MRWIIVVALWAFPGDCNAESKRSATLVEMLSLQGNKAVSGSELKSIMLTRQGSFFSWLPWVKGSPFKRRIFIADLGRVISHYKNVGFYHAAIDTVMRRPRPGVIHIELLISEGEPVRVADVDVVGLPVELGRDSLAAIENLKTVVGLPLVRRGGVEQDQRMLTSLLQNNGFPFGEVSVKVEVKLDVLEARVFFSARPGPLCVIGKVRTEGNNKVAAGVIRRGLTFSEGDLFRKRKFLSSQRQLYRSGAFRSVSIGLPDSVGLVTPVDILVAVRERQPRKLKLGGGYDTEERVRGSFAWQHRNFFGGARQFGIEAEASALKLGTTLNLRQPYIFGSKTWLHLSAFVEQERPQEIRVKKLGSSASIERTYRATGRLIFQVRGDLVDFKADSTRTNFVIEYQEDSRDDFFNPQRGVMAHIALKESGFLFKSRQELLKVTGEGRFYRPVRWRSVLAMRIAGGVIHELSGRSSVPNFERFFSGGANSVRGWSLNQLSPRDQAGLATGGLSLIEASLEIRTRILPFLGTAVYLDAGNVGVDQVGAFDLARLKVSMGYGIRYLSPIGPLRLDLAYRLSEDAEVGKRQIYFSLGQAF